MTIQEWLAQQMKNLEDISSARLDLLLIAAHQFEQSKEWVLANSDHMINEDELHSLEQMVALRAKRIPLAQILGQREFYGRMFFVNEHVLVPRPETEVLVQEATELISQSAKVLELGTGSGCISISLALERPDLHITATDISAEALSVASRNADTLGTSIEYIESDLFDSISSSEKFDAILANLPYVPVNARRQPEIEHEPDVALYGGDDGLDLYRIFFSQLRSHLKPNGVCLVEYSPTQHKHVRELLGPLSMNSEPLSEYIYRISSGS